MFRELVLGLAVVRACYGKDIPEPVANGAQAPAQAQPNKTTSSLDDMLSGNPGVAADASDLGGMGTMADLGDADNAGDIDDDDDDDVLPNRYFFILYVYRTLSLLSGRRSSPAVVTDTPRRGSIPKARNQTGRMRLASAATATTTVRLTPPTHLQMRRIRLATRAMRSSQIVSLWCGCAARHDAERMGRRSMAVDVLFRV